MLPLRAGLLAALAVTIPATGEPPRAETIETPTSEDGYSRLGPFHLKPRAELRSLGYDSNIFLTSSQEVGDFTATLSPGLEAVTLFGHRARLDLFQSLDAVGFLHTSSQNHLNSRTSADLRVLLGDLVYDGGVRFRTEKLRPTDEIDARVRQEEGELHGRLSWPVSDRSEIAVRGSRRTLDYSGDPSLFGNSLRDLNRTETTSALEASLRIRPKTDALLEIERISVNSDVAALQRDATMTRLVPGLRLLETAAVEGELHFGLLRFEPDSASRTRYSGPVGRASLSARLGPRLRVTPQYERDLVFSVFGSNLFYLQETYGMEVWTPINRRLRLETGGSLSHIRYPERTTIGSFDDRREDRIRRVWAGWSLVPAGSPRYGFRVEWRERDSNFDLEDDSQVRLIGEASYAF